MDSEQRSNLHNPCSTEGTSWVTSWLNMCTGTLTLSLKHRWYINVIIIHTKTNKHGVICYDDLCRSAPSSRRCCDVTSPPQGLWVTGGTSWYFWRTEYWDINIFRVLALSLWFQVPPPAAVSHPGQRELLPSAERHDPR